MSTSCSVLALLIIVMILFLIKRNRDAFRRRCAARHHRHMHMPAGSGGAAAAGGGYMSPPPPPYTETQEEEELRQDIALVTEHDRTALISFADGSQATLPSYSEVTRGRYPAQLHRVSGNGQLPVVSQQLRNHHHHTAMRDMTSSVSQYGGGGGDDRHSMSSHTHSIGGAGVANSMSAHDDDFVATFGGSVDTMNVSDNTSASVTVGTYESGASNPSLATSRAMCGSIASSSNPSLTAR